MGLTETYRRVIENLSTAVIYLDAELEIRYMNPAAEMLFAASVRHIKKKQLKDWFAVGDEHVALLQESSKTGHPYTHREEKMLTQAGQELTVDYTVNPMPVEGENWLLIEIVARDRLIRIEREEELISRHATAKMLVRGLAHEIKNPLGGIRGAAQLLERELGDESLHDYTHVIIEEADRLRNLVDRMLGPRNLPNMESVNIHSIIERVCRLIDAESRGSISLVRDYDPSIPDFIGDSAQLIQAVLNIVRNAMQALVSNKTENPTITLQTRTQRQVTLGTERHRLVCCLRIVDNGPGIPESIYNQIFYPMVSGRADGTGLGLSIAQSIIGQHHGLIECDTRPGRTCFELFIPLELKHEPVR